MVNVEKPVECLWKSMWGKCGKVSTDFYLCMKNSSFTHKNAVLHKVLQKIYYIFSTFLSREITGVAGGFYTFST